jgi:predicted phosphodiesterase
MKNSHLIPLAILVLAGLISCIGACSSKPDNPADITAGVDHIRWGAKQSPLEKVTISWRSAGAADLFRWGYSPSFEKGMFKAELRDDLLGGTIREYMFDKVKPSSTLYYSIYDSENYIWTDPGTFQTAPDPALNHFSFTAGGDSRTDLESWHLVSEAIERLDFALYLGDLVNNGKNKADWEDWYAYGEKFISNNLVFYVKGNHDEGDIFHNNLVNPGNGKYYSFEYGNAILIGLEDHDNEMSAEQTAFIDSVFRSNTDKTWRIVFFHRPFYTSGFHAGEMDHLFDSWWKLFDDYGVDLIFNGHQHNYTRTKPINRDISDTSAVNDYGSGPGQGRCEIIAGSYGAPRYGADTGWFVELSADRYAYTTTEINGNELILKAFDAETGEKFDEMILHK